MSGGGAAKRAGQQSARITEEGQRGKEASVQAVNKLFGEGNFRGKIEDQTVGFTKPERKVLRRKGFLADRIYRTKFQEQPIIQPGEDQAAYDAQKAAWEVERDKNKGLREDLYAGNRNAVLDVNKNKLDRDLSESERQLRFSLGRSGLFAGSEDIAQHGKQRDAYDQGVLQSTSLADQSAAGFRSADERSRLDVINQIQGGADSGTGSAARGPWPCSGK